MRFAIDMQAAQTESRHRGIGYYTLGFVDQLIRATPARSGQRHELIFGIDSTYPDSAVAVTKFLRQQTPLGKLSRYSYPRAKWPNSHEEDRLRPAARSLVRDHYARLGADLVHLNSVFEGFVEHAAGVCGISELEASVTSVTMYDLIPLVFQEQYLREPEYATWYRARLRELQKFDLLLCISESTRRDVINLLGIPECRTAVIHAGVASRFTPMVDAKAVNGEILNGLGIGKHFVLYTGNGDFRKNLPRAIEAFARIPKEVRGSTQLVLNQVEKEDELKMLARRFGLGEKDLVITGKVSDATLVALLQSCDIFFYPSLYEGFGLPVLEAMACGAPILAGDNSSLREIVGRQDALFNASDVHAAAQVLSDALGNSALRCDLASWGLRRSSNYSWERTAELAVAAWEEAVARKAKNERSLPTRLGARKKVAIVTPLPVEATGIAAYAAQMLAAWNRRFEVELFTTADFALMPTVVRAQKVSPWMDLKRRANEFDAVFYQFGNSPFHMHMLELLEAIPGIVVMHDIFLSSLLWYMDECEGNAGLFARELEYSHGRGAVQLLQRQGHLAARLDFPASKRVIEKADAIIVHSSHSLETIVHHFPDIRRGHAFVAPMPIIPNCMPSATKREALRSELGIKSGELAIVSFGFVADTKMSHLMVQAVAALPQSLRNKVRLFFVGENDGGEYGRSLLSAIAAADFPARITGYVDDSRYAGFLSIGDIAIQLRCNSRGETSKAIYDCMGAGMFCIVNDYASFRELEESAVIRVSSHPTVEELSAELTRCISDSDFRKIKGAKARKIIELDHNPDRTASVYAAAIASATSNRANQNGSGIVRDLVRLYDGRPRDADAELCMIEHSMGEEQRVNRAPHLVLDISEVVDNDYGTGIHRVVRNLARELALRETPTRLTCQFTAHDRHGRLRDIDGSVEQLLGVPSAIKNLAPPAWIEDDIFMMLDSAWEYPERFDATIAAAHKQHAKVGALVYDLIPILHPQFCVEYMPAIFENWLRNAVSNCDFLVCISKAIADDLSEWIDKVKPTRRDGQRIGYVHLGSDLDARSLVQGKTSISIPMLEAMARPAVLMVGTVEPRKGYETALAAFESLWLKGLDLRLVIVGRQGWNVEGLADRLRSHPEMGDRLHWLQDADDADLEHAYASAVALVQASYCEGFGLPIVEASRFGTPLVLSNLPVFLEIAEDSASYFEPGDETGLATLLLAQTFKKSAPLGQTWSSVAGEFLALLSGSRWITEGAT